MTITCLLCREILSDVQFRAQLLTGKIPVDHVAELEYQAAIGQLGAHVQRVHADYVEVLQRTANTYLMHLIAKLGTSHDENFETMREEARRLVYWTLAGTFAIEQNGKTIKPGGLVSPT